jgi:gliding motility-associated-like protein
VKAIRTQYLVKFLLLFGCLLVQTESIFGTHYRAGEITYKLISGYTYEIIAITYTDPENRAADRPEIEINFDDGTTETVSRTNGNGQIVNSDPNNTVKMNIYRTTHTFPGPFSYLVNMTDPNRIDGIKNINGGNSVQVPFYVESLLTIKAGIGTNQSPVLLLPPLDVGCVNQIFTHNPAAYDPDGDSLAFVIVAPKRARGIDVQNWTIPRHSDSFNITINDGQVTWTKPVEAGHYNWAIRINEYRGGKLIGYIVRDMQVYINNNCNNNPPSITKFQDDCVEANSTLVKNFSASDPNALQTINILYYGGPFVQKNSPATINPKNPVGPASGVNATFTWKPSCNAIRYRDHMAVFRALDNHPTQPLADITYWNIKVVGPAPKNVKILEDSNGFRLSWDRDTCRMARGYRIYRRIDSSYWKHAKCETGVPAYTKYVLYDSTQGVNNTTYFDNNGGRGISPFIRYCYIITSVYLPRNEDGTIILIGENSESYASDEVCDMILRTKPIITKVSVEKTGEADGVIQIRWLKPEIIDSIKQSAPYRYQLQKSTSIGGVYQNVGQAFDFGTTASLSDTVFLDNNINTVANGYYYKVLFYTTIAGKLQLTEESALAGSVFVKPFNTNRTVILNWVADVPWVNTESIIFRKNNVGFFDSIGYSNSTQFADTGLINGNTYCYKIETKGKYNSLFYPELLRNFSQEVCGVPVDTIRPCVPELTIDTPCNSFTLLQVKLLWDYPSSCDQDVVKFRIYWKKNAKEKWTVLDSVPFGSNQYIDTRESLKYSIAGCYAVIAVDSFNNESYFYNERCIDNCPFYEIPNVFTPGTDDRNDRLRPFPYRFIDKVDLIIYNRWGQMVFETSDININWDGKDLASGVECSEGVYYYIADVYESYLDGTKKRTIRGTVTIIR